MTCAAKAQRGADIAHRPAWLYLPPAGRGQCIGVFGGSFNPPHAGHAKVSGTALKRLGLDAVWWLVSPGNPLKEHDDLAPLESRVKAARKRAGDPRVRVTGWEATLGTAYSAQTVQALRRRRPDLNFVWIMGADNLATFHRWRDWQDLMEALPVAVIDRPGAEFAALRSPAARRYARHRVPEQAARSLALLAPPAWCFLHTRLDPTSSTQLRGGSAGVA